MSRPNRLNQKLDIPSRGQDGQPSTRRVTVAERICEQIEATGCTSYVAAGALGIPRSTVESWLREASALLTKWEQGTTMPMREVRLVTFLLDTQAAFSRWVVDQNVLHAQLARGGLVLTETQEKVDSSGRVIERKTIQRTTLPDAAAIRWNLERKARSEGFAPSVEVTGKDGGPLQVDLRAQVVGILASIDAYEAGMIDAGRATADLEAETKGNGAHP